uniref:Uncharacterized protein n=1 Tax=Romanomermis culicivorax TaxID=13658 RepID=A0A915HYT9_ROMCU
MGRYVSDSTAAILISILLFVIPAERPGASGNSHEFEEVTKNKNDSGAILSWKHLQTKFPWDMLLLIGGSFGMAEGVKFETIDAVTAKKRSGLAEEIGGIMAKMDGFSPLAMCAVTALITTFLTEFTSNAAAVIILTPILQAAAVTLRVNPLYLLLTCTVCVSYAFMLPVATVPNAIVFGTGLIRVADMAKIGFIMNSMTVLITLLAMSTWAWHIFDFGIYPDWAPTLNLNATYGATNMT